MAKLRRIISENLLGMAMTMQGKCACRRVRHIDVDKAQHILRAADLAKTTTNEAMDVYQPLADEEYESVHQVWAMHVQEFLSQSKDMESEGCQGRLQPYMQIYKNTTASVSQMDGDAGLCLGCFIACLGFKYSYPLPHSGRCRWTIDL